LSVLVKTRYHLILPDEGFAQTYEVDWPQEPGYDRIKSLVEPLINDEPLEHVSVLYNDRRADMFVSGVGAMAYGKRGPLPRNDEATHIYRAASMRRDPTQDPEDMPAIYGPAVIFDRIVWY